MNVSCVRPVEYVTRSGRPDLIAQLEMLNDVAQLGVDVHGAHGAIAPLLEPGTGRETFAACCVNDKGCRNVLTGLQLDTCIETSSKIKGTRSSPERPILQMPASTHNVS